MSSPKNAYHYSDAKIAQAKAMLENSAAKLEASKKAEEAMKSKPQLTGDDWTRAQNAQGRTVVRRSGKIKQDLTFAAIGPWGR